MQWAPASPSPAARAASRRPRSSRSRRARSGRAAGAARLQSDRSDRDLALGGLNIPLAGAGERALAIRIEERMYDLREQEEVVQVLMDN